MSWSVAAFGKSQAVRINIADQFSRSKCTEPEETVRLAAAALIDAAIAAQDLAIVIEVSASGSQSFRDWNNKTGVSNSVSISIQPKHGFLE